VALIILVQPFFSKKKIIWFPPPRACFANAC
jgi:hypothetical protein